MLKSNNQLTTEIEDLTIAVQRAGYSRKDINYLIDRLQDDNRGNSQTRNTLIHQTSKILMNNGNFNKDRTEEILRKITGLTGSYITRIRNSKTEYQSKIQNHENIN